MPLKEYIMNRCDEKGLLATALFESKKMTNPPLVESGNDTLMKQSDPIFLIEFQKLKKGNTFCIKIHDINSNASTKSTCIMIQVYFIRS